MGDPVEAYPPETLVWQVCQKQVHEFLNELQVIKGWLQLGAPDKALEHVDQTARRFQWYDDEGWQEVPDDILSFLFARSVIAGREGINVAFGLKSPPSETSHLMAPLRVCLAQGLTRYRRKHMGSSVTVTMDAHGVAVAYAGLEKDGEAESFARWLGSRPEIMRHIEEFGGSVTITPPSWVSCYLRVESFTE